MQQLELRDYLHIAWKRKSFIAVPLIGCVLVALALTLTATPVYESRAIVFVGQQQVTASNVQQGVAVSQLSQQLLATYAEMIRTTLIVDRARREGKLDESTTKIAEHLKANRILNTQLLQLAYPHRDPAVAKRTVNAVAHAFVSEIERIEGARTPQDKPAIQVSLLQAGRLPTGPVSPRPIRNLALGFLLGLVGGVVAAFLVEYLDTTVKRREDFEDRFDLLLLATIPRIRTRVEELYLEGDNQSMFAESFRKLRTAIQLFGGTHAIKTILVTSPFAREGKTTVSVNLAAVFAYAGNRTVLVEADLRRPVLHRTFQVPELRGLTTSLTGQFSIDAAIMPTEIQNLHVVPAGAIPQNPVELLSSVEMNTALEQLAIRFDTIIVDAPPLLPVADASTLAPRADGTVVIARSKETRRDRLRESIQLIEKVGGRALGVVLNAVDVDESQADYGYYTYATKH